MSINTELPQHAIRAAEVITHPDQFKNFAKDALPVSAKRSVMRLAGSIREAYWRTFHPFTFGAAIALTDVELTEVVLVQQSYCNTDLWQLPGGGIDKADKKVVKAKLLDGIHANRLPKEYFLPSAVREAKEEVGVLVDETSAVHVGNYPNFSWLHEKVPANRDTLGVFHVPLAGFSEIEFRIQQSELKAAERWSLGNIMDRTIGSNNPDPNMAWYLGSVAAKIVASNGEEFTQQLQA